MTTPALAFPLPLPALRPHSPTPQSAVGELATLRAQLQAVAAGTRTVGSPYTTSIAPLDAALGGGVPRGRITEVVGTLGSGKTALLRQVVTGVLRNGGWVAWIDARRTLAAAPWADVGDRLVVVRPHTGKRSAWCADMLLRSGVFSLVVIDGARALSRVHGVRLAQLARERDAACVVLTDDSRTSRISGAVRLRVRRTDMHERVNERVNTSGNTRVNTNTTSMQTTTHAVMRGFSVVVEKGGPLRSIRSVEVQSDINMARRVCAHSEIPDRRGVARGTRRPWAAVGGDTTNTAPQPVTWGGLAVSTHNDIHAPATRSPATSTHRDTAGIGPLRTDTSLPANRERFTERGTERFGHHVDTHTRDWTKYRGRRRAGESSYGKPTRRARAKERIQERIPERTNEQVRTHALGRVAESASR